MLAEAKPVAELPRLLDLDNPPPHARVRWYWRYIQRWRRQLFYLWREQTREQADDAIIARAVDDLLAVFLMMEYLRRKGQHRVSTIQDMYQSVTHPSVFSIAECVSQTFSDPILAAALDPEGFDSGLPIPDLLFHDHWERRIADATWLLLGDNGLPLSLFGDFHQLCVGNPLTAHVTGMNGQPARRVRGMYYTPAPIVDYLVSTTLDQVLADRHPDELFTVRLLDPSCGCGAFLIGCVRYLFRWLARSLDCGVEEATRMALTIAERMLHGCDIDSQNVF